MNKPAQLFLPTALVLILLMACGDNDSSIPEVDTPRNVSIYSELPVDEITDGFIEESILDPVIVTEEIIPSDSSLEQRYYQFMEADDYVRHEMINRMENFGEDVELIAQLMTENIPDEIKVSMLQTLMYGEHDEVAFAIYPALNDSNPDVVLAAVDCLTALNSQTAISALQALVNRTDNEDVRDAANNAIDFLSP